MNTYYIENFIDIEKTQFIKIKTITVHIKRRRTL